MSRRSPRRCPVSSRLQLLHAWIAQITALLPGERVTRGRVLALFALGMVWADTVRVHRVAAALPLGVRVPSVERRLRRFLANPAVTVAALWRPLLPALLAPWAGREVVLVLDVREVQPHDVDARFDEAAQHPRVAGGRADGRDDLGAAHLARVCRPRVTTASRNGRLGCYGRRT